MGGFGRSREKLERNGRLSLDDYDKGSAARTRPFSLEEIMLRRKNRDSNENVLDRRQEERKISLEGAEDISWKQFESERNDVHGKYISSAEEIVDETVKIRSIRNEEKIYMKEDNLVVRKDKEIGDKTVNMRSRRKEEKITLKEDNLIKIKDSGVHGSKIRLKSVVSSDISSVAKGVETDKVAHGSRESDSRLSGSRYEARKKHSRDSSHRDGHADKDRSVREKNKTYQNGSDKNPVEGKAERKYDRYRHDRKMTSGQASDNSKKEYKKHLRDPSYKDGDVERSKEISERESKRKHKDGYDDKTLYRNGAKNHDLGRYHVSQISDRQERQETKKSRHEEPLKRKWSRNQSYIDRFNRSPSHSPRANKRLYHDGKHKDFSSHSMSEWPRKQETDVDRNRISNNCSSSHPHRHGGSTSGLGGYSPRKRTEPATKTHSPSNHFLEKKSAKWDLPPAETERVFSVPDPSNVQSSHHSISSNAHELVAAASADSSPMKPLSVASMNALLARKNASVDSVQLTQATRPMRRLCLENLPYLASDKSIMDCLNKFLLSADNIQIQRAQPCISCVLHKEKGQALVEFLTPEDASAALSFDGSKLFGSVVKVRRPKDYVEASTGDPDRSVDAVVAIGDVVEDTPDKIFIGGVSKDLSSDMLMEIVSAFGPLKAYHFEVHDISGPSAFVEYEDHSITIKACAGLNGMKLAGQVLTVVQTMTDPSSLDKYGNPPCYDIPEHAEPLLKQATQVLKLKNVFTPGVLSSMSNMEIEEILEDVRLECARFGTVKSINVVKHNNSDQVSGSEAYKIVNDTGSKGASGNTTDHEPVGTSNVEYPSDSIEVKDNKVGDGKNVDVENCAIDLVEDESCQTCHPSLNEGGNQSKSENTSQECPIDKRSLAEQSESHDNMINDDTGARDETKSIDGDELQSEEADGKSPEGTVGVHCSEGAESLGNKRGIDKEQDVKSTLVFEPGSVFVEYLRTEASCMGAHCLHGRSFDDRKVAVEYIALDLYKARFMK